jgi:acetyl esterase/lipase
MFLRIGGVALLCGLAGLGRGFAADEPSAPPGVVVRHNLRYRAEPSKSWVLDLAMKKDRSGKPRPGLVFIHGGGWIEGDKSSFTSRKYGVPSNIEDFAALGYVAVTVNYRLAGEAPFPAALEDCKCAVRWLRAHAKEYHLDPKSIGSWGNSAGGHLALMLALAGKDAGWEGDGPHQEESSMVQAAVSDSGPVDVFERSQRGALPTQLLKFMGGPPEGKRAELYKQASPAYRITKETPPLLLIYGVGDEQVPVETADQFVLALDRAGMKDVTYLRLASVGHCPHSLVRIPYVHAAVIDFFDRTLMHPETAREIRRRVNPR